MGDHFSGTLIGLCTLLAAFVLTVQVTGEEKYLYQTKHIEVPVDHFSFASNATFQLRYLVNNTWWREDGPIFFYTGNEGDIDMFAQNTGFMWEIASEFQALVVFAEHRYYGQSMPFGNQSFTNPQHLGYLTSAQALEDFVSLIVSLKADKGLKNSAVIAFGGSYGGMLAAWIRMKYPHIVAGSIAASAPILQFTGLTSCYAFGQIVTSDYKSISEECSNSIRNSWAAINNVTSSDAGKASLSTKWKLCSPLKTNDDVKNLKSWLSDIYTNLAMVDYPYPANFLAPLPAYPIREVCSHLVNSSLAELPLLEALSQALNVYVNYTGKVKCVDIKQNASPALGDQGWDFQACTEMVMPQCTDGKKDFFEPDEWNFKEYSDKCFKQYGVRPQPFSIINRNGGHDLSTTSNIVFSNGLLDPWCSGGVMRNLSRSAVAVIIPEGAHHLDLRASDPQDPTSVRSARKIHRSFIRTWIKEYSTKTEHDFNNNLISNSL